MRGLSSKVAILHVKTMQLNLRLKLLVSLRQFDIGGFRLLQLSLADVEVTVDSGYLRLLLIEDVVELVL